MIMIPTQNDIRKKTVSLSRLNFAEIDSRLASLSDFALQALLDPVVQIPHDNGVLAGHSLLVRGSSRSLFFR